MAGCGSYWCWILCLCFLGTVCETRIYTKKLATSIVQTKFGRVKGALVEFSDTDQDLKPVEAYKGLQYSTTLGGKLRFIPPSSSAEKWRFLRLAFSYRSVCPQKTIKEQEMVKRLPLGEIERLKRIAPKTTKQDEECLSLNLYRPAKGFRKKHKSYNLGLVMGFLLFVNLRLFWIVSILF